MRFISLISSLHSFFVNLFYSVLLETSQGDIVVDLFYESCPLASENFLKLCKLKYYNCLKIDKLFQNYAFIFGDPTGTGTGGDSIWGFLVTNFPLTFYNSYTTRLTHSFLANCMDLLADFSQMKFYLTYVMIRKALFPCTLQVPILIPHKYLLQLQILFHHLMVIELLLGE